jgi:5,6-dimethylbenzimidazole synthase
MKLFSGFGERPELPRFDLRCTNKIDLAGAPVLPRCRCVGDNSRELYRINMGDFSEAERQAVYRAISCRRDVRSQFTSAPIADEVLGRLLMAAHHAPSVGFMQPWEFIIVRSEEVRRRVLENFLRANQAAAESYEGNQRRLYESLKLEGILESAVNLCVTCNQATSRGSGLGRHTMPETALYSTVCAIENLWLAARAEGIGVGWVSILDSCVLREALEIPEHIVPVAYLCLGHVSEFGQAPELELKGWEERVRLSELVHFDRYGNSDHARARQLLQSVE